MFNAEARKYVNEAVLTVSPAPDVARRSHEDTDVAPSMGTGAGVDTAARVATGAVPVVADVESDSPVTQPYSPIVLADSVRLFELLLVFVGGIVAYISC